MKPSEEDHFLKADFQLGLPDGNKPVRALIVLIPGWKQQGLHLSQNREWQKLGKKWDMGLLACEWQGSMPSAICDQVE